MLGHIAIAAMGGCFSQDPDTGAAEATYFPAESVALEGNIRMSATRPKKTTDFAAGFTQTRFWTKQQVQTASDSVAREWAHIGTLILVRNASLAAVDVYNWRVRHWDGQYGKDVTQDTRYPFTFYKKAGTDTHYLTCTELQINHVQSSSFDAYALSNHEFSWDSAQNKSDGHTIFWGDLVRNDEYDIRWRRLPMRCLEHNGAALYEADSKQLVEY